MGQRCGKAVDRQWVRDMDRQWVRDVGRQWTGSGLGSGKAVG